ncbi:uncharacterized protein LOC119602477 [Lucilia sericata]|uniref:uncharacterized protein LOC119602477 n=1 Tax=Lucilia sericata TaxID=13632 RepID=UPI0018A87A73|nr:uncharacterized protein LOC119602477 [Lucilia sericata]
MSTVNERIEKLKRETRDLRKEVKDLKETLQQQNELIISLLSKQTGILNETIEAEHPLPHVFYGKQISEYSRRFPLENMKDLEKFETEITDENENHIITIVQALIAPKGLTKSISNVLSENLIMEINVDGYHNKKRLLNFPKTIDIIFMASRNDNEEYNNQMFLNDLRRSLRMVKNRIHKNNCQARQKLREQQEQAQMQETVEQFIIKTEEADFD